MPGARLPSPRTPSEWRRWIASVVVSTVLFGVLIVYWDRSWSKPLLYAAMAGIALVGVVGSVTQVRKARRVQATAPPDPREVELRELDEQIDRLADAEPELRALVARRDAAEISEEEFVRHRDAMLGGPPQEK
jgi:hypothetical protein